MKRILAVAAAALLASSTLPAFAQTEGEAGVEGEVKIEEGMDAEGSATLETDVDPGTTASINITTEQETELRPLLETDASPISADFEVSVGATVPQTVTLRPLPPRFIEVVPDFEGYQYIVLEDGRILIIEPEAYQVVYIMS